MESDEGLKTRHSYYAVWGKFLREAVECFGERSDFIDKNMDFNANNICFGKSYDQTKTLFYHGISCKMLFTKLCIGLRGPFSTTLQYETAVVFASKGAGDGIIITVEPLAKTLITFFDCRCWSDFGYESEMLFLGGIEPMKIVGLTGVGDGINYDEYIHPMVAFHSSFRAIPIGTPVNTHHEDIIYSVISGIVDEKLLFNDYKKIRKRKSDIPVYIQQQFKYICDKTVDIRLNLHLLEAPIIKYKDPLISILGYPNLAYIYISINNKRIKWDVFPSLFPSLRCIFISRRVGLDEFNSPSVLIDDSLLGDILSIVSDNSNDIALVSIASPLNSLESLASLITKHELLYRKYGYVLGVDSHPEVICSIIHTKELLGEHMKAREYHQDDAKEYETLTNQRQCGHCSKYDAPSRCSRCKVTYYCDVRCQSKAWKHHKKTCKTI
eukprot:262956_1